MAFLGAFLLALVGFASAYKPRHPPACDDHNLCTTDSAIFKPKHHKYKCPWTAKTGTSVRSIAAIPHTAASGNLWSATMPMHAPWTAAILTTGLASTRTSARHAFPRRKTNAQSTAAMLRKAVSPSTKAIAATTTTSASLTAASRKAAVSGRLWTATTTTSAPRTRAIRNTAACTSTYATSRPGATPLRKIPPTMRLRGVVRLPPRATPRPAPPAIPPAARPTMMRLREVRRLPPRAPSKRCSARSSSVCSPAWLVTITTTATAACDDHDCCKAVEPRCSSSRVTLSHNPALNDDYSLFRSLLFPKLGPAVTVPSHERFPSVQSLQVRCPLVLERCAAFT